MLMLVARFIVNGKNDSFAVVKHTTCGRQDPFIME